MSFAAALIGGSTRDGKGSRGALITINKARSGKITKKAG
jgi:hypothetical protein